MDPTLPTRSSGIDAKGWVKSARLVQQLQTGSGRDLPARWVDAGRSQARARLDRWLGSHSDARGIAGAMLLGDRRNLSDRSQRQLRESGLVHLIAISGLHVGLIWGLFARLSRRFRHGHLWLAIGSIVALPLFGYLVGARPSVVRAILFTGLALAANALGRRVGAAHVLTLACTLSLAGHPSVWASGGFQLSFAATAGLVLGAARLAPALPLPPILGVPVAASVASYIATAPFSASMFGQLAPASLWSNLLGVPLAAGILIGGYASLLISIGLDGPALPGWTAGIQALEQVSRFSPALGPTPIRVAAPNLALSAGGLLAVGLIVSGWIRSRCWIALWRAIAVVALVGIHIGPPPTAPTKTRVQLLDVGQGQSVWLQRGGRTLLIDAGGNPFGGYDPGARVVVPALLSAGVRRLNALAVSHEDTDHAAGVEAVLRTLPVDEIWLGPDAHRSPRLRRLRALARRTGAGVRIFGRHEKETRFGDWIVRGYEVPRSGCSKGNDRSLVLRIADADSRGSVLIPGDLEECGLTHLLDSSGAGSLQSRLLILAHHGSRSGTTRDWLRKVDPVEAWVSAGFRNRFGHPHRQVRDRIREAGLQLRRTDREGTVVATLDAIGE